MRPSKGRSLSAHVRLDRLLREQRALGALDRNVHKREVGDRLRLPVLEDLEVFLLQIAHVVPARVGYERVDFDVVDLNLEGRSLGLSRGGRLSRRLTGRCLARASALPARARIRPTVLVVRLMPELCPTCIGTGPVLPGER